MIYLQYYPTKYFFPRQKFLSDCNFRLRGRMIMIFCSTCSPMHEDNFTYPYHVVMMSRKFSTGGWSWKTPPKTASCSRNFQENHINSPLWVGLEPQKWPLRRVFSFRNRLRCRIVIPFAFTDWYDPKQHCKYLCWHAEVYKVNFWDLSKLCDSLGKHYVLT